MLITSEHLNAACHKQFYLFNKTFPNGAEFNKTNWDLALSVGLEVDWMVKFLNAAAWKTYHKAEALAWKTYNETRTPASKIYKEVIASVSKARTETITPVWKIHRETEALASKAYYEATTPAWKMYEETKALALFNILEKQFNAKNKLLTYLKSLI